MGNYCYMDFPGHEIGYMENEFNVTIPANILADMLQELEPVSMDYSKEAYYNNYLTQLMVFLYQSEEYDENSIKQLYEMMEANYGDFIEYIYLNGIAKTSNLEKREYIFNNYIKQTINVKKYIK